MRVESAVRKFKKPLVRLMPTISSGVNDLEIVLLCPTRLFFFFLYVDGREIYVRTDRSEFSVETFTK